MNPKRNRQALRTAGLFALAMTLVTCGLVVPRKGWSKRWGPLVPHKTFPGDCSLCHVPDRWDKLRDDFSFDHEKETGVALKGAHKKAACLRCHNDFGPVEAYVARGCAGCHQDPHGTQLGGDCTACHTEENWRPVGIVAKHARTRFPLVGRHAVTACSLCHIRAPTGDFRGASKQCAQCHQAALAEAQNPDHRANGWVTNCERCHTPRGWSGAAFDHLFFPLSGGHALTDCSRCHTNGGFDGLTKDCLSCHADDRARAPGHDKFSVMCQQCHNTSRWEDAEVDHSFFPLTAGHALTDCSRCHTNGGFEGLSKDCLSCHADDRARAPNHDKFPTTCQQCHTTTRWKGAVFNHRFPLRGEHNVDCSVCHTTPDTRVFSCFGCHEHSRDRTDKKHREVNGYTYSSAACVQCHPNGEE